jgi:hypothetical protein
MNGLAGDTLARLKVNPAQAAIMLQRTPIPSHDPFVEILSERKAREEELPSSCRVFLRFQTSLSSIGLSARIAGAPIEWEDIVCAQEQSVFSPSS